MPRLSIASALAANSFFIAHQPPAKRSDAPAGSLGDHDRVADLTHCEAITFLDQRRFGSLDRLVEAFLTQANVL